MRAQCLRVPHSARRRIHAVTVLALAGCAGNGEGLDVNGRPPDETGSGQDGSLYARIQDTIFTPACTSCHAGAAAPLGLRLDPANSHALLVGVPSAQVPSLQRVAPGNADASYLVQKIEGRAPVGARMPLGGPPLEQSSIDLVRAWIAQGAPPPAAAAAPASFRVVATTPAAGERVDGPAMLVVIFSAPVDASLAGSGVFTLRATDAATNREEVALGAEMIDVATDNPAIVRLRLPQPLAPGTWELVVRGTGATALADVDARILDGDADGTPGGDHRVDFAVAEPRP